MPCVVTTLKKSSGFSGGLGLFFFRNTLSELLLSVLGFDLSMLIFVRKNCGFYGLLSVNQSFTAGCFLFYVVALNRRYCAIQCDSSSTYIHFNPSSDVKLF